MNDLNPEQPYTVEELIACIDAWVAEINADEIRFDESAAVHATDDTQTTDERAMASLERPERFDGEHQVARMWLQTSNTARIWTKNGTE
jgi:pullulanase/glycogen debranching enzyme